MARYRSSRSPDPRTLTSIHELAGRGCLTELQARHAQGVAMDEADEKGDTPLLYAVFQCQGDTWRWLLSVGADPAHANAKGDTVIHHLTRRFKSDGPEATLADLNDLLAAGAPVDAPNREGYSPVMLEARRGQNINTLRDDSKQPRLLLLERMTMAGANLLREAPDGLMLADILDNDVHQRVSAAETGRLLAQQRLQAIAQVVPEGPSRPQKRARLRT